MLQIVASDVEDRLGLPIVLYWGGKRAGRCRKFKYAVIIRLYFNSLDTHNLEEEEEEEEEAFIVVAQDTT